MLQPLIATYENVKAACESSRSKSGKLNLAPVQAGKFPGRNGARIEAIHIYIIYIYIYTKTNTDI